MVHKTKQLLLSLPKYTTTQVLTGRWTMSKTNLSKEKENKTNFKMSKISWNAVQIETNKIVIQYYFLIWRSFCMLYISTSVWVLRTPNAGRNSHFQHFPAIFAKNTFFFSFHQNASWLFYSQKMSFFSKNLLLPMKSCESLVFGSFFYLFW